MITVEDSYKACYEITRRKGKNFYYTFLVLPRLKRRAMYAVYAFMRHADDIADDLDDRELQRKLLEDLRGTLSEVYAGRAADSPILPAFADAVHRFCIPQSYFLELITGAEMDLSKKRYRNFDELYGYCYKVAGTVGLVCARVFGCAGPDALKYAEYCGIAFQLTNIIRDVREDAGRGRIYLPQEDLERFGYPEKDLLSFQDNDKFRELIRFQAERARQYYEKALPLFDYIDGDSRPALEAMMSIYGLILKKTEKSGYDVMNRRIKPSFIEKISVIGGLFLRSLFFAGNSERRTP